MNQEVTETGIEQCNKKIVSLLQGKFCKKAIILIDEYDTPIQEAYLKGYYDQMIELMRGIFGPSLKDNNYMGKAVVTGITRVAQESLFSGVNNLEVYSFLRKEYGQYFGFTEPEVDRLIEDTGNQVSLEAVKEWYNGYRIGPHVMYNPWSILSCLKQGGKLGLTGLTRLVMLLIKQIC